MRSRFLMELTTPEVEGYFSKGGKTAILPVGCVEMHGPHQPIGTDTLIAKAFALRIAEIADGLVLPEVHYTWSGATDGFIGTLSIGMDLEQQVVEAVVVRAFRMGFKRVIISSVHGPNNHILYLSARKLFAEHHLPVFFLDPYKPFDEVSGKIFEGEYEKSKEASLVLAALKILGQPDLYSEKDMCYDDEPLAFPASQTKLEPFGGFGYFMQEPRQHACPSRFVSLQKGSEFFDQQLKYMETIMDSLDTYTEDVEKQQNRGWYK